MLMYKSCMLTQEITTWGLGLYLCSVDGSPYDPPPSSEGETPINSLGPWTLWWRPH